MTSNRFSINSKSCLTPAMQLLLVLSFCGVSLGQPVGLTFRPITAEYSTFLDRIIMISAAPNQLHIYDPVSQSDTIVALPKTPLSLSVNHDGKYAAVGHDLIVSYVNLQTPAVEKTFPISGAANNISLASEWFYTWTASSSSLMSIRISTGAVTNLNGYYSQQTWRLNNVLNTIYSLSSNQLSKFNVSAGPLTSQGTSYVYDTCGNLWFSPDGSRIYFGCPTVYRASADANLDKQRLTSFQGIPGIASLTESPHLNMIAVIPQQPYGYTTPPVDNSVALYSSTFLTPIGRLQLPEIAAGPKSFTGHGKWIFFNQASSSIYVVMQADSTSGLLNDFAVTTFSTSAPIACGATFSAATASVIAQGSLGTVNVVAGATCRYQIASDSTWLEIVSGGAGSGNNTVTYIARKNETAAIRTGTLSVGGINFVITQNAAGTAVFPRRLATNIVDAVYDKSIDRLVFVSAGPDELHVYDPVTDSDQKVQLPRKPTSVSVRPSGGYAAVIEDGWISYINLRTLVVEKVLSTPSDAKSIVLADNGYIYLSPGPSTSNYGYSLEVSTGKATKFDFYGYSPFVARLHPNGNSLYGGTYNLSKSDISAGIAKNATYVASVSTCQNFWISEDGLRYFTACGQVYRSSESTALGGQLNGSFSEARNGVVWASHSALQQSTVLLPRSTYFSQPAEVQIYGDAFLGFAGRLTLPKIAVGATQYDGNGKFAFWNAASDKIFVIQSADSAPNLLSSYGITTILPSTPADGCTFTLGTTSATLPPAGGLVNVAVTTGSNCVWKATSPSAFATVSAGSFGFGTGYATIAVVANTSATSRTASLTIAGQTFTVNQTSSSCTYSISPSTVNFKAGPSSATVNLTTAAGCAWTQISNAAWLTGTNSGTGNGTVNYSLEINPSTIPRSGTLTIAGQTLTVNQTGLVTPGKVAAYSAGNWIQDSNGNLQWDGSGNDRLLFWSLGRPNEIPVYGDWSGDGITKVGLYIDGTWLLDYNGNGFWDGPVIDKLIYFGGPGYEPLVGDWNGSGSSKIAVHQNGTWLIDYNGNFAWDGPATDKLIYFGGPGYSAVLGDWNASGTTKIGVHQTGTWLLDYNGNFAWDGPATDKLIFFGGPGFTPLVGDWNGSGSSKIGAHQNGTWLLDFNGNFTWDGTATDKLVYFGGTGYTPVVGDWNGTGTTKIGAYNAGQWVLDVNGNFTWDPPADKVIFFGGAGQTPIVGKW